MQTIHEYFKDYGAYHKTSGNKACHVIGIPLIVITLLGLLHQITFFRVEIGGSMVPVTPAFFLLVLANLFYLRLHLVLGASMVGTTIACYFVGGIMPVSMLWALFVLGWILQLVGHYKYEHKAPAFAKNLTHILIGPAYVQNMIFGGRFVR